MSKLIEEKLSLRISFYLFGIGTLSSWNAILSELDYFDKAFPGFKCSFIFPMLIFALNFLLQLYLVLKGNIFKYKTQLTPSLIISIVCLLLIPITSYFLSGTVAFVITSVLISILGLATAIIMIGFYAIASYMPFKYMVYFNTGLIFSGVLMNGIGFICYSIFRSESLDELFYSAVIYFFVCSLLIGICTYFLIKVYSDRMFIYSLRHTGEFTKEELLINNIPENIDNELATLKEHKKVQQNEEIKQGEIENEKKEIKETEINVELSEKKETKENKVDTTTEENSPAQDFLRVLRLLPDLAINIYVSYFITFLVFPGAVLLTILISTSGLNILILLTIYNVSETIGREIPNYFIISRTLTNIFIIFRILSGIVLLFCGRSTAIEYPFFQNKAIIAISLIVFSFLDGYLGSLQFYHGTTSVEEKLKGPVGSAFSFMLVFGVFSGSVVANFVVNPYIMNK